jgi:Na+-transporting methylmalonyl-CoA/oxaloacetate decarboxylase gamma subunit
MEGLESLLPILIFLVYFLSQFRKRRLKTPQPIPNGEVAPAPVERKPTPFQELLRQIQEAAEASQRETSRPEPAPATTLSPSPTPPPPVLSASAPEFHSVGGFEHDEHGFGSVSPFSEEAFERQPLGAPPPTHASGHLDYSPHAPLRQSTPRRSASTASIVEQLRRSGGLRDALILQAILDRPQRRSSRP